MKSEAKTVGEYLKELDPETRKAINDLRKVILNNIQEGFVESMNWGMISYEIPLKKFWETYNKHPLMYVALAAQKRHNAIYLMNLYADPKIEKMLKKSFEMVGKKLDMGKSCIRFKQSSDLNLEAIGKVVAYHSVDEFIEVYKESKK